MPSNLIIWEVANLYAGDDGPNNSKHLTLRTITLPSMKEKTEEHHAGGALAAVTMGGFGLEALELAFTLGGVDAQTKALFGLGARQIRPYTIYGVLRSKNDGREIERKAVVFGRMMEMTESEFERGRMSKQDHRIAEITHYELYEDKQEVYFYDHQTSIFRVNGLDQWATARGILRIA